MEHNHKNLDCYFFYYSTCKKGDFCPYRHEPSALGCETMCTYWQQGNCLNEHCNFRHMELKKNRKSIPCYWETQPGGCRKPHCPFMHTSPRTISSDPINPVKTTEVATKSPNQEWLNRQDDPKYDGSSTTESDQGRGNSEAGSFIGSPAVDPLIVKFEEAINRIGGADQRDRGIGDPGRSSGDDDDDSARRAVLRSSSASFRADRRGVSRRRIIRSGLSYESRRTIRRSLSRSDVRRRSRVRVRCNCDYCDYCDYVQAGDLRVADCN